MGKYHSEFLIQPCLTPVVTGNEYVTVPPCIHYKVKFSYNNLIMLKISITHEYVSQDIMVYAIKSFLEIDEVLVERCLPFNSLFNDYSQYSYMYLVNTLSKACLFFSQEFGYIILHSFKDDTTKYFGILTSSPLHQSCVILTDIIQQFVYAGN